MTELTLTAVYEEAEEGGYIGYVAELPGANTQGETLEEVRENLIGLYRSSQLAISNRQSI
jgi:predicted RNase H-like HicB family nuclease